MTKPNNAVTDRGRILSSFWKGIAILLVILVHSTQRFDLPPAYTAVQRFSQLGCQIFFVLSSFGLCHSFGNSPLSWWPFMKKRLSKLAPAYWGAIGITSACRVVLAVFAKRDLLSLLNIPGIIVNGLFLHGFVPIHAINNALVRGGWFVGTTVILYGLFPLLYRLYFRQNAKWERCRCYVFPGVIFCLATLCVIAAGHLHPALFCGNNSFSYFSFVNQLTPFALGFVLFDICRSRSKMPGYTPLIALGMLAVTVVLFFGGYAYSFVFVPSAAALTFLLVYAYMAAGKAGSPEKNAPALVRAVAKLGDLSFSVYLMHTFIVYEFTAGALRVLHHISQNDLLWYAVLLPVQILLSAAAGCLYDRCLGFAQRLLGKIGKKNPQHQISAE